MSAPGIEYRVIGAKRLSSSLRAAGRKIDDNMISASSKAGADVAQRARGRAPRRSGALARSTSSRARGNTIELIATVIYAGVIHNGWPRHNIEPQPYLRETAEREIDHVAQVYADEAQRILNTVKGA